MSFNYTDKELLKRGYRPVRLYKDNFVSDMQEIASGRFKDIINLLVKASDDGHFDPAQVKITDGTPSEVVEFIQSFMLQPTAALPSEGENALMRIIPRSIGDATSLREYLDYFERELNKVVINDNPT